MRHDDDLLSLIVAITRMSSIEQLKNTGFLVNRQMMLKNLFAILLPVLFAVFFLPIFAMDASSGETGAGQIIDMLIDIIPTNIIEPFETNNTLQVSVMALLLGFFLLAMKSRTKNLTIFINEANQVMLAIVSWVCLGLPAYIYISFLTLFLDDKLSALKDGLIIFVMVAVVGFIYIASTKLITALRYHVPLRANLKYTMPVFLKTLGTDSSIASLEPNRQAAVKHFGVKEENVDFPLAISQLLYTVDMIIHYSCCIFCLTYIFDIKFNLLALVYMLINIFICSLATPPVAGSTIVLMSSLIVMAGLPDDALIIYSALFIVIDSLATAVKCCCVCDELVAIDQKMKK